MKNFIDSYRVKEPSSLDDYLASVLLFSGFGPSRVGGSLLDQEEESAGNWFLNGMNP